MTGIELRLRYANRLKAIQKIAYFEKDVEISERWRKAFEVYRHLIRCSKSHGLKENQHGLCRFGSGRKC
ncbi:MAG: hypothetical protein ABIF11_08280 [Nitrospirota bacterium]